MKNYLLTESLEPTSLRPNLPTDAHRTVMLVESRTDTGRQDERHVAGGAGLGTNQTAMRAYNERLVLSLIRQSGPMSKAEIARVTGLSAQTVSVIMRALEQDGFLTKGEPVRGKVGQPSVPMGLRGEGAFFLGLKIGRRGSELLLTDFLGDVKFHRRETHRMPAPDDVVAFASEAIREALDGLPNEQHSRVAGLGVALPFRLWDWADTMEKDSIRLDAWRTCDLAAEIGKSWDFPVYICNDASAACGAELVFGDQNKPLDFLYFYIGYFVGGGLVLENALYTGRTGNAAALGSVLVTAEHGDRCQLVEVASLVTLEQALVKAGEDASSLWNRSGDWQVPQGVLDEWLDQAASGLAQAIASSTCLIDFETVLIDGSVPPSVRAALVARTAKALRDLIVPGISFPDVTEGVIGYDAKTLGAASLPLSDRFLVDRDAFLKG